MIRPQYSQPAHQTPLLDGKPVGEYRKSALLKLMRDRGFSVSDDQTHIQLVADYTLEATAQTWAARCQSGEPPRVDLPEADHEKN